MTVLALSELSSAQRQRLRADASIVRGRCQPFPATSKTRKNDGLSYADWKAAQAGHAVRPDATACGECDSPASGQTHAGPRSDWQ